MTPPFLSVVIPAFNESLRLPHTLGRCMAFLDGWNETWEIIVVDDGSSDDTAAIVERLHARDARVRLLRTDHGGKGQAVRTGMLEASGKWRMFADADLSVDLSQLPKFFETPTDIAIASREAPGAERIDEPPLRHLVGRVFNWCVRLLVVPGIQDTQCGQKVFTAAAVRAIFPLSRIDGFAFDVELLFLARRAGLRIREVPVMHRYRAGTRVGMQSGLAAFRQLLQIRRNSMLGRYEKPPEQETIPPVRRAGP